MDWAVSTVEDVEILKRLLPASKAARCQEGGRASGVQLAMPCICRSGIARDFSKRPPRQLPIPAQSVGAEAGGPGLRSAAAVRFAPRERCSGPGGRAERFHAGGGLAPSDRPARSARGAAKSRDARHPGVVACCPRQVGRRILSRALCSCLAFLMAIASKCSGRQGLDSVPQPLLLKCI